jgi:hypothetical protein
MAIFFILYFAFIIFMIAAEWKTFEKAGQPGWACIIPFYNFYIMAKIAKVENWWLIFIPLANIYIAIVTINGISKAFGKDVGFTIGMIFLPFIFWPILGFGDAKYQYGELNNDINNIGNNPNH